MATWYDFIGFDELILWWLFWVFVSYPGVLCREPLTAAWTSWGHFGKKLSENDVQNNLWQVHDNHIELQAHAVLGSSLFQWSWCFWDERLFWSRHGWVSDARHGEFWCMEQVLHMKLPQAKAIGSCDSCASFAILTFSYLDWFIFGEQGVAARLGVDWSVAKKWAPLAKAWKDTECPHTSCSPVPKFASMPSIG